MLCFTNWRGCCCIIESKYTDTTIEMSSVQCTQGVQRRIVLVVSCSCFLIIIFCFVVAICYLAHNVEVIFYLPLLQIPGHHSYFRKDFQMLLAVNIRHYSLYIIHYI